MGSLAWLPAHLVIEKQPEAAALEDGAESPESESPVGYWKKHTWTAAEDAKLLALIPEGRGKVRWSVIGESMACRSGKQCRERWHNHLSPEVNNSRWSPEQDRAIVEAVHLHGTCWSEIVKLFPGRTDAAIKNRWNSMLRKEERRRKRVEEGSTGTAPSATKLRRLLPLQRAGLVDLQPSSALLPVPPGTQPAAGSTLEQLMQGVGVPAPQIKPSGRRKVQPQTGVGMDAASLLLAITAATQDLGAPAQQAVTGEAGPSCGSEAAPSTEPVAGSDADAAVWAKLMELTRPGPCYKGTAEWAHRERLCAAALVIHRRQLPGAFGHGMSNSAILRAFGQRPAAKWQKALDKMALHMCVDTVQIPGNVLTEIVQEQLVRRETGTIAQALAPEAAQAAAPAQAVKTEEVPQMPSDALVKVEGEVPRMPAGVLVKVEASDSAPITDMT